MSSIILTSTMTVADVAQQIALRGRKVVYCRNPGDAASPVILLTGRGSRVRSIGQSATYRHCVERAATAHAAVLVCGYWDRGDWYASIDGLSRAVVEAIARACGTTTVDWR